MQRILKALALAVAVSFLVGAVLTAARTSAAAPDAGLADAGSAALILDDDSYFSASKSGPMPRPRRPDGGTRTFFPASKSPSGMALPQEQSPQQQAP